MADNDNDFWKAAQKGAKKGVQSGVQQRLTNVIGGGSGGNTPYQNKTEGRGIGKIVLIVLIFLLVAFIKPLYSECQDSGFCRTRIAEPLEPVIESVKDTASFIGEQAGETRDIISGERSFSWTGDVEERTRSGLWFDTERTYGIVLGEDENGVFKVLSDEFGATIDVVVGKIDQKIKSIDAVIRCSIEGKNGIIYGKIRGFPNGNLILSNPFPDNKRIYDGIDCGFSKSVSSDINKKIIKGQTYFSEDIVFNLTYTLKPFVFLPVFVIQDSDIYNTYRARLNDAFDELEGGLYDDFSAGVNSRMQYDTDVQAYMKFINQPLYSKEEATFGVQFKNTDLRNKAKIKEFRFALPLGLSIVGGAGVSENSDECNYFGYDSQTGQYYLKNDDDLITEIERSLNRDSGETRPYLCTVRIDESSFGKREFELLNLGDVEAQLVYDYMISEVVKLSN